MDKNTSLLILFISLLVFVLIVIPMIDNNIDYLIPDLTPNTKTHLNINIDIQIDRDELEYLYYVYRDIKYNNSEVN